MKNNITKKEERKINNLIMGKAGKISVADSIKSLQDKMTKLEAEVAVKKQTFNLPSCPLPHYPNPQVTPPAYIPNPNIHFHNGQPCYQMPCVWC